MTPIHNAMLREAVRVWKGWKCSVIAIEDQFRFPLLDEWDQPTGWTISGTADLVVDFGDRVVIVDHKTASSDAAYSDVGALPYQVGLYFMAYPKATEFVYFVCIKPRNKQGKDESEAEFESRISPEISQRTYHRNEAIMEAFKQNLYRKIRTIELMRDHGLWSMTPNACRAYGSVCQYAGVCSGSRSLEDLPVTVRLEDLDRDRQTIRQSSLNTLSHCSMKYVLDVESGRRIEAHSAAMTFGTEMHVLFERYWDGRREAEDSRRLPDGTTPMPVGRM